MAVFRRQSAGVEKDQDDDEPVERLRLDDSSTELTTSAVDTVKPATTTRAHLNPLQRKDSATSNKVKLVQ